MEFTFGDYCLLIVAVILSVPIVLLWGFLITLDKFIVKGEINEPRF